MPDTSVLLLLRCPSCAFQYSALAIMSASALTVTCDRCGHQWAHDVESVPAHVREVVYSALAQMH